MKTYLQALQNRLKSITEFKYISKDFNQLTEELPPVKFPCAIFDITNIDYSNTSHGSQIAEATITITIANLQILATSAHSPNGCNDYETFELVEQVFQKLQNWKPLDINVEGLTRTNIQKVTASAGYDCYRLTFTTSWIDKLNVSTNSIKPEIRIEITGNS